MTETIKIYCANCKDYILDADLNKLSLPFKGWMFSYPSHVEWDTAFEPDAQGKDLVCPMCEWQFHDEPELLTNLEPVKWVRIFISNIRFNQMEAYVAEPEKEKPPKEKPHEQKRRRGRPKGSGKLSKPAITRRDKRGNSETPDPSADQEWRDRNPANHPQFGQLADGGTCIDTGAGSSSEEN